MKSREIHLSGGVLTTNQFEEFMSKSRISIAALFVIFPILLTTDIYNKLPEPTLAFGILLNLLLAVRIYWNSLSHGKDQIDSMRFWRVFRVLAFLTAFLWGTYASLIIFNLHHEPKYAYFAILAVYGIAAGGIGIFFPDLKLSYGYLTLNIIPPSIACFFSHSDLVYVGFGGLLFFAFFFRSVKIQHDFFWRANRDRNFLNTLFDNLPCPMSVISSEMKYIKVNNQLAKSLGYSPEEYIGKHIGFHTGYQNSKEFLDLVGGSFGAEKTKEKEISISIRGEQKHFYFVTSQLEQGESIVCISLDLTDLKKMQIQLEAQKAMGIEAARLSSVGEVANSMAHEINNPLAIILGKTYQAQKIIDKTKLNNNDLSKCFEVISSNVNRISNIIKALRQIVGNQSEEFENSNLAPIIESAKALTEERFKAAGIEFRVDRIPNIELFCNSSKISQVLLNTLNNAYDAVLTTASPWVQINFETDEYNLFVLVTDSGPGVPDRLKERLFHPFFTTKDLGKGIGLSLSVSKGIIEGHKGQFYLDNECKNTRFVIVLPKYAMAA